jgi:hypothetical protein
MATTGFKFIELTLVDSQGTATGDVLNINPDHILGWYAQPIGNTVIYTSIPGYPEYKIKESPEEIVTLANE